MMGNERTVEIAVPIDETRANFVVLSVLTLFFAAAFFVNEVDWQVSTYENYTVTPDEAEDQVAVGKSSRKVSFVMIGLVGALLLVVPSRQRVSYVNLPCALLGMYALVCVASLLWTDATWLTAKRLVIGGFGLLAAVGATKQLSTRDLIDLAVGVGTILLLISVFAELRQGTFAPSASTYRFAGIVHPNTQGGACGLIVIAAYFGMKSTRHRRFLYLLLLLFAGAFLLLTKSRTTIAACLCAVSTASYFVASANKKTLIGLLLPTVTGVVLVTSLLLGFELSSTATAATRFGRDAEADFTTINGRLPLWSRVLEHIAERPLLGYGYQGFWTPDRVYEVSLEQEWTVPNAHSAFLDTVLGTGLVGSAIFGLFLFATFGRIVKRCRTTKTPTDCFVFALFIYATIQAIFESGFSQPNGYEVFITLAAILRVVCCHASILPALRHSEPRAHWTPELNGGLA